MSPGKFPNGLQEAMKEAGIGPTALGRLIGENKQDVSRWAKQERKLPPAVAAKIAPHVGKSAGELLLLKDATSFDANANESAVRGPLPSSTQRVPYGGHVRAGEFLEVSDYFSQDDQNVVVPSFVMPHPDYDLPQTAWLVEGDSMNLAGIGDGYWVVCADYLAYRDRVGELFNGQYVVVERTRYGNSERERTVKEVQFTSNGMRLVPRSSNPVHKEFFIPWDRDADPDEEQVSVLVVVLSIVRDVSRPPK